jgi:CHAD domain-containing protein
MPPFPKPAGKTLSRTKPVRRQRLSPKPRLNGAMACDTAFRIVARRHLDDLVANREATANGDETALHQMRIALTHLRTAILFFSPMVEDAIRNEVRDELKWLNGELGAVRDLDVAVDRIKVLNRKRPQVLPAVDAWNEKRNEGHRTLSRILHSVRYQWLIDQASGWIENGPWSTKRDKPSETERAQPIGDYTTDKLLEWEKTLVKRSRKLRKMGTNKRHRLRLLNKKLTYSIDSFEDLFEDKKFAKQKAALKQLRRAQRSLGQLNDGTRGEALAEELKRGGVQSDIRFLKKKREKRLLKKAAKAYRRLDKVK